MRDLKMISDGLSDFCLELEKIYLKYIEEQIPLELSQDIMDQSLVQKTPLLYYSDFELNREKISQAFMDVCRVFYLHQPKAQKDIMNIEEKVATGGKDFRPLVKKFFLQDYNFLSAYAYENSLHEGRLIFILFNTVKPFVINQVSRVKNRLFIELWRENYCPLCGWEPLMLDNDGDDCHRLVQCSMCDIEWYFDCPEESEFQVVDFTQ
ncbi:MAG: hypothetical protein ACYDG6_05395 [Thermincolia bacterium]